MGEDSHGDRTPGHRSKSILGLLVLALVLPLSGCISTLPPAKGTYIFARQCLPASTALRTMPASAQDTSFRTPSPRSREAAAQLYSPMAVEIADVMDLLPLLDQMARLELQPGSQADAESIRRKLLARLQLATLEVSSLVAEIECEVNRADEIQDRLKEVRSTRTTFLTILGVIFGGLANILSGGIGMAVQGGDADNIASVIGGGLEVLFGTQANFTKVQQEFSHPRNHLAAVWDGDTEHTFFSERVWRFLTQPDIRDLDGHSLRDVMLTNWREQGRLGEPGSQREQERKQLFFGRGGLYTDEDLHAREAMLQQLESSIQLIHQDLENLLREVLIRQTMEEETA